MTRTIGHDALRVAFENERNSFNDLTREWYLTRKNSEGGTEHLRERLKEFAPDLHEAVRERWEKAGEFTDWIRSEYIKQQTGGN